MLIQKIAIHPDGRIKEIYIDIHAEGDWESELSWKRIKQIKALKHASFSVKTFKRGDGIRVIVRGSGKGDRIIMQGKNRRVIVKDFGTIRKIQAFGRSE